MTAKYQDLRVLVVEDDTHMRTLIKSILEHLDFESAKIHLCMDGTEALDLLTTRAVDFIICDWVMDGMDGPTFVRVLRDPKQTPARGVPVILCSGRLDGKLIEELLRAGVNEVVVKPVSIGAIESRIRAIFENPRSLFENEHYVGPDRRRRVVEVGPRERRTKSRECGEGSSFSLN